jgi:hypothetical protein
MIATRYRACVGRFCARPGGSTYLEECREFEIRVSVSCDGSVYEDLRGAEGLMWEDG